MRFGVSGQASPSASVGSTNRSNEAAPETNEGWLLLARAGEEPTEVTQGRVNGDHIAGSRGRAAQ